MNLFFTKETLMRNIKNNSPILIIALVIFLFARPNFIYGSSMSPTLESSEVCLLEKVSYLAHMPQRGDIVVVASDIPLFAWFDRLLVKRVIGLPGDLIEIKDNKVSLNGAVLDEPYIKGTQTPGAFSGLVPEGHVFVLGDNRGVSLDSRQLGPIAIKEIKGKLYMRVWPLKAIGQVE